MSRTSLSFIPLILLRIIPSYHYSLVPFFLFSWPCKQQSRTGLDWTRLQLELELELGPSLPREVQYRTD